MKKNSRQTRKTKSKSKAKTKGRHKTKPIDILTTKRLKAIKNAKAALERLLIKDWSALDDLAIIKLALRG